MSCEATTAREVLEYLFIFLVLAKDYESGVRSVANPPISTPFTSVESLALSGLKFLFSALFVRKIVAVFRGKLYNGTVFRVSYFYRREGYLFELGCKVGISFVAYSLRKSEVFDFVTIYFVYTKSLIFMYKYFSSIYFSILFNSSFPPQLRSWSSY